MPNVKCCSLAKLACVVACFHAFSCSLEAISQDTFIPRRQSQPPGPPLSATDAMAKMTLPDGFRVELVASEPDLLNPVAMAFDDRGRIFVTESFEYPRREPGPGRDRIKILEDTDGDGKVDSVKVFAEGLNIPSGIAVGYGGVWVGNAPDILFLEDTDGDDRADKQTVIATGFGRYDTHELPNAFTWGPDGYLYGLNGVFNRSIVEQGGNTFDFTCAMFRINPITHEFDLFSEGTSNPWGITFDDQGSAFVSACVIDHLWHLTETGYYHRQAGAYPPHTWKIDSIVDYKHQMAAYCGIEYFDSPAYPEAYRQKLYMGNIHGGCINVDSVTRYGSTYRGAPHDDFLTANDVWFMPVAQKTGPDGCLYILDWYDRYHCYQDANADPQGVDRGHGRLYRLVYEGRPEIQHDDLSKLDNSTLITLLQDPNIFYRQRAAIILSERLHGEPREEGSIATHAALRKIFTNDLADAASIEAINRFPLYALTTLLYAPQSSEEDYAALLKHAHPLVASWAVRAVATRFAGSEKVPDSLRRQIASLHGHGDPRVRLQVAIAANKIGGDASTDWLLEVLDASEDDGVLPRIVWQNLEPHVVSHQGSIVERLEKSAAGSLVVAIAPRVANRLSASLQSNLASDRDQATLGSLIRIAAALDSKSPAQATATLARLAEQVQQGELELAAAASQLAKHAPILESTSLKDSPIVLRLRAIAGQSDALEAVVRRTLNPAVPAGARLSFLQTAMLIRPETLDEAMVSWSADRSKKLVGEDAWRKGLLPLAARRGEAASVAILIAALPELAVAERASLASLLCQRQASAIALLESIQREELSKDIVGPNQVRALAGIRNETLSKQVGEIWGTVRQQDSEERKRIVAQMTQFLKRDAHGDAKRGWAVWDRVCGQCHKLHDRGFEVGPSLTSNGRGSFDQLVVSVFDPSLVIGNAYQAVSVLTVDGRVINGIVTERGANRLVLLVQGGKQEVIPMNSIELEKQTPQSLMPEGLEAQITPQEIADLFALLSLQKAPESQDNGVIAGTPEGLHRD